MTTHKRLVFPDIKPRFEGAGVPAGFVNDVRGWTFTRPQVEEAAREKKLLTLDVDLAGKGSCSLGCSHCFRRGDDFAKEERMDRGTLIKHLQEAKTLGLRTVKIIGPGEPLEEKGLLDFLRTLREMDITPLIFTKGHVLGDDALAQRIHGMSSRELCAQLKALDVSILLGTTSFDPTIESSFVGRDGYHARRDAAIRLLDEFGFNEFIPGQPTRLAFICTPITPMNVDEVFDIYVFARTHNIQPVFAPTMVAGRALGKLLGLIPDEEALLDLYVKINLWNIEHGRTTIEEIESTGVTAYAGGAPCNQVAVGMFIRGTGDVLRCPGNGASFQGNLDEKSLTEIWVKSENLNQFAGKYNCGCPAKEGISFPDNFFEKVMARLKEVLGSQPGDNS